MTFDIAIFDDIGEKRGELQQRRDSLLTKSVKLGWEALVLKLSSTIVFKSFIKPTVVLQYFQSFRYMSEKPFGFFVAEA